MLFECPAITIMYIILCYRASVSCKMRETLWIIRLMFMRLNLYFSMPVYHITRATQISATVQETSWTTVIIRLRRQVNIVLNNIILLHLSISHANSCTRSCSFYGHTVIIWCCLFILMISIGFPFTCRANDVICSIIYARTSYYFNRCRSVDVFGGIVRCQQPSGVPGRHDRPHGRLLGRAPKHVRKR